MAGPWEKNLKIESDFLKMPSIFLYLAARMLHSQAMRNHAGSVAADADRICRGIP